VTALKSGFLPRILRFPAGSCPFLPGRESATLQGLGANARRAVRFQKTESGSRVLDVAYGDLTDTIVLCDEGGLLSAEV